VAARAVRLSRHPSSTSYLREDARRDAGAAPPYTGKRIFGAGPARRYLGPICSAIRVQCSRCPSLQGRLSFGSAPTYHRLWTTAYLPPVRNLCPVASSCMTLALLGLRKHNIAFPYMLNMCCMISVRPHHQSEFQFMHKLRLSQNAETRGLFRSFLGNVSMLRISLQRSEMNICF
jgi:hypothetical protein